MGAKASGEIKCSLWSIPANSFNVFNNTAAAEFIRSVDFPVMTSPFGSSMAEAVCPVDSSRTNACFTTLRSLVVSHAFFYSM